MKIVYVLFREVAYEGDELEGIFATREAAERALAQILKDYPGITGDFRIEEVEVQS